jgi:release factor glutamine methyltransferase
MEQLMSHVLNCPRLQLYIQFEAEIPESQLVVLRAGLKRLGAGEPLQYVVGDTEFMGHRFKTDRRALIPRPDTEPLVSLMLECAPLWADGRPAIVDVGTGSGCIVISLAMARPNARYQAVDLSEAALGLARENADLNAVGQLIEFRQGDLLAGFEPLSCDVVVANLPYISTAMCGTLARHIREHEPMTALEGGADGLDFIRKLTEQGLQVVRPGGRIFLEIGFDQGVAVVEWLSRCGYKEIQVHQDLGNRDRIVSACR